MNTEQILMCVVALILGMLLANMLKYVCGCKLVEGQEETTLDKRLIGMMIGANQVIRYAEAPRAVDRRATLAEAERIIKKMDDDKAAVYISGNLSKVSTLRTYLDEFNEQQ